MSVEQAGEPRFNLAEPAKSPPQTQWHQLLGTLLELLLTPVGITVQTEVPITSEPPRADILLLRRESDQWTEEQRRLLPEGIRDTLAQHVLLEFKYSESVTVEALQQAVGYDYFYGRAQRLADDELATFILSSRTPRAERLAEWGYERVSPGVYRSVQPLLSRVGLILLNELPAAEHNAFVKVFASRQRERDEAFQRLNELVEPTQLEMYLLGLRRKLLQGENTMSTQVTPQDILELGEAYRKRIIETATPQERLAGLEPQERLAGLEPQERLAGLEPQERLAGLEPQERLAGLEPQERLAGLEPQERLAGLKPQELTLLRRQLDAFLESLPLETEPLDTDKPESTEA